MTGNPDLKQKQLMRRAELVLQEHGLLTLPVDLDALAQAVGVHLREMDRRAEGVSGMLMRYGDQFGIMYATHTDNEGFERFSIGHEFGHYFVDGHLDHIPFDRGVHRSRAGFVSEEPYEREADYFSAGLLMPTSLIRPILRQAREGLPSVEAIRSEAKASLTASAIRYINETDDAAAIVVSRQGRVDYCFKSEALKQLKGQNWLRKGAALPTGTLTASVAARPAAERQGRREEAETDILDWFGGDRTVRTVEQVVDLGRYDRVLTVLSCAQIVDDTYKDADDFEESDEGMESRWTPQFRR